MRNLPANYKEYEKTIVIPKLKELGFTGVDDAGEHMDVRGIDVIAKHRNIRGDLLIGARCIDAEKLDHILYGEQRKTLHTIRRATEQGDDYLNCEYGKILLGEEPVSTHMMQLFVRGLGKENKIIGGWIIRTAAVRRLMLEGKLEPGEPTQHPKELLEKYKPRENRVLVDGYAIVNAQPNKDEANWAGFYSLPVMNKMCIELGERLTTWDMRPKQKNTGKL